MSTILRTSKLIDDCAPSISYDEQVQAASGAFDNQMYEIIDDTGQVCFIPSIMQIYDETLIDILAWQFHVDFYDRTRDLEFRKNLVQMSIQWHITKGTYQLVQDVLDTFWPKGATLTEWFDYYDPLPVGLDPLTPPAIPYPTMQSPPIVPAPPGTSWHDRYRFRIYVNPLVVITPSDEQAVLNLINAYKPVSRWCEGVFRARTSQANIGWCGMMLRFVYRFIAAPTNYRPPPRIAETYQLVGPASSGGMAMAWSDEFYVALNPGEVIDDDIMTIRPSDGGAGGVFIPPSVRLTNDAPIATFLYNPPAVTALLWIQTSNDCHLDDPPAVSYASKQRVYTLTGPSSGGIGYDSTPFTVTLQPE